MAQQTPKNRRRGPDAPQKVSETMAAYEVLEPPVSVIENGATRMSSKNQITLPVAMVRMLGLQPGDEIGLLAMDGAIYLEKQLRGRALHEQLRGSMRHVSEWNTKEAIDAYVRDSREDDDEE